jgi:hypothetical protein
MGAWHMAHGVLHGHEHFMHLHEGKLRRGQLQVFQEQHWRLVYFSPSTVE